MKRRYLLSAVALGLGLAVVLLLLLTRHTPVALADPTTYYVREGASGNCLSTTTPCGSIQDAINLTGDGDEVRVATGAYTENLVITRGLSLCGGWDISFTVQSPVTYPTTIDGSGAHVISATVETGSALIVGFTIGNGRDGVHVYSGVVTLTNNLIYSTTRQGIEVTTGTVWIEGNTIHDTGEEGFRISGGTAVLSANLVYDTGRDAIHTDPASVNVEIRGNTVYSSSSDGIDARGQTIILASNVVYAVGKDGIHVDDMSTAHIQSNTIHGVDDDCMDIGGGAALITGNLIDGCGDNGIKSEGVNHTTINANQVYQADDAGINLADAGAFTVTNNIVAGSGQTSVLVETGAGPHNLLYHNSLVGSATGQQGTGISVMVTGVTITLVNNIVVSHNVGITATPGATLVVSNTLLWGNGDDPVSGTAAILAPPLFVAPAHQDYHLRPGSPAIDAGIDVGLTNDVDGDPRPIGALPDVGADEFPAGLSVIKWASPDLVQPGAQLTYTIHVTNTGMMTLTATITDVLPDHVSPAGTCTWTPTITAPGGVWTQTVVVTVEAGYVGPLTNVALVTTDEGATGVYTHTLAPDLDVTKQANPDPAQPGECLTYTIYVTNTGNFHLHATVTDTLPAHITPGETTGGTPIIPGGMLIWTPTIAAPGGVWTQTVVVTVETGYSGPLTNVVQVTTDEGATGIYTAISIAEYSVYLPLVLRNYQTLSGLQNPGFEGITCHPDSLPGWCDDNWTRDTFNGSQYSDIFTPQGWVTFWSEGVNPVDGQEYGRPECKVIPNKPPFVGPPARIHGGNYAVMQFGVYRAIDSGVYQVVTGLAPHAIVQLSAYAHAWTCDEDRLVPYSCGDPEQMLFRVGIDPNGGADPWSPDIVWASGYSYDEYRMIGPAQAEVGDAGTVTVFLRATSKWPYKYNDAYWDDALLTVQSHW